MKKIIVFFGVLMLLLSVHPTAFAESNAQECSFSEYSADELYEAADIDSLYERLPEDVKDSLDSMGVNPVLKGDVSRLSFTSVISEILSIAGDESKTVFMSLPMIVAVLLIYSLMDGFSHGLTNNTMTEVLSVVSALCIACALVVPTTKIIESANNAVAVASDFMLAYIPVMVAVLISCGKTLSGSGYYSVMIMAAEGIAQLSSRVISPMLNVFLGVSICEGIVPQIRLQSLTAMFSKTIKWMLSFSFTVFSAFLTFKTLITASVDNVSTRAVRYTMSSFIPVVGTALSEAYRTVQGSVNILKNGVGVFVIFAVCAVFLPIVIRLLIWLFTIGICKTFAQMMNLITPEHMLTGISTVLSVLLAVILCVMALFIISTALIVTAGGYS